MIKDEFLDTVQQMKGSIKKSFQLVIHFQPSVNWWFPLRIEEALRGRGHFSLVEVTKASCDNEVCKQYMSLLWTIACDSEVNGSKINRGVNRNNQEKSLLESEWCMEIIPKENYFQYDKCLFRDCLGTGGFRDSGKTLGASDNDNNLGRTQTR